MSCTLPGILSRTPPLLRLTPSTAHDPRYTSAVEGTPRYLTKNQPSPSQGNGKVEYYRSDMSTYFQYCRLGTACACEMPFTQYENPTTDTEVYWTCQERTAITAPTQVQSRKVQIYSQLIHLSFRLGFENKYEPELFPTNPTVLLTQAYLNQKATVVRERTRQRERERERRESGRVGGKYAVEYY